MSTLEEIKARLEEARPGPWEVIEDEGTVRTKDGEIMFDRSSESGSYWNSHGRRNAEFIAHAPEDQAKLIAALEAVEAELLKMDEISNGTSADVDAYGRGIDRGLRIAVVTVRQTLTEAMQ